MKTESKTNLTGYHYSMAIATGNINPRLVVNPKNMQSDTRIEIQEMKRFVMSESFLNFTKNTIDQAIMYVFLDMAYWRDNLVVSMSSRAVAISANCLRSTATGSINRLKNIGLIEPMRSKYRHDLPIDDIKKIVKSAKAYRIAINDLRIKIGAKNVHYYDHINAQNLHLSPPDMSEPGTDFYLLTRDVFVNGHSYVQGHNSDSVSEWQKIPRLNKTAGRVFITLLNNQLLTSRQVSEKIGYGLRATQYALSRLNDYGMVIQVKIEDKDKRYNRWVANKNVEFSAIEKSLGIDGWRDRNYEKCILERDFWKRYIDDDDFRAEYNQGKRDAQKRKRGKGKLEVDLFTTKIKKDHQRKKAQRLYQEVKDL